MRVRDREVEASVFCLLDFLFVAVGHCGLIDCVGDGRRGSGVLVQFSPGVAPLVAFIQLDGFAFGCTVGLQLYADARRTDAVLVVCVVPDLRHSDFGLFRRMRVRDGEVEASVFCLRHILSVSSRFCGLIDTVSDGRRSSGILVQSGPGIGPLVLRVQFDRLV